MDIYFLCKMIDRPTDQIKYSLAKGIFTKIFVNWSQEHLVFFPVQFLRDGRTLRIKVVSLMIKKNIFL